MKLFVRYLQKRFIVLLNLNFVFLHAQAKMALRKLALNSYFLLSNNSIYDDFFRKKTHAQLQSQFGHKNAKLKQLSSLLSKSRLQI